jgi:hypothetical protein
MNMLFAPAELNPVDWWLIVSERCWQERQNGTFPKWDASPEVVKKIHEVFPYHSFMVN